MVEQSDRAPLLDWEEIPPVPPEVSPQSGVPNDPVQGGVTADISPDSPHKHGGSATDEEDGDRAFHGLSVRDRRIAEWEEKDQIVAVFVVTFDTRSGEVLTRFNDVIP